MNTITACTWCNEPMDGDLLGDGRHPACGDPANLPTAIDPETLGPCIVCGQITVRYGDAATSTLCDACQEAPA